MNRTRSFIVGLALPMLSLIAAYGVYDINRLFVPTWVAVFSAAAFEITAIGLSLLHLRGRDSRYALVIASIACGVSILYNSLSGFFHLHPEVLQAPSIYLSIALAVIHGIPLPSLALAVAWFLLHHRGVWSSNGTLDDSTSYRDRDVRARESYNSTIYRSSNKGSSRSRVSSSNGTLSESTSDPILSSSFNKLEGSRVSLDSGTDYRSTSDLLCGSCGHSLSNAASFAAMQRNGYCTWCHPDPVVRKRRLAKIAKRRQSVRA